MDLTPLRRRFTGFILGLLWACVPVLLAVEWATPRPGLPTGLAAALAASTPAAQSSRVDLPDPEGPTTAVKVPGRTSRSTRSSARTARSPSPYVLVTPSSRTAVAVVVVEPPAGAEASRCRRTCHRGRSRDRRRTRPLEQMPAPPKEKPPRSPTG